MRVNARKVIAAVAVGKAFKQASSCWTDGLHVYSYATCIAARVSLDGITSRWVLNDTKYSPTTSIYQGALRLVLSADVGSYYHVFGFNGIAARVDGLGMGCAAYRLAERANAAPEYHGVTLFDDLSAIRDYVASLSRGVC